MAGSTKPKPLIGESAGFLADGQKRLLAGIHEEALARFASVFGMAKTPAETQALRKQLEKEVEEQVARLDSPYNAY